VEESLRLTRKDFQRLADLRARDAGSLSKSGNQQGAYYLAGYAVECALKACIAKKTRRHEFPPKRKYIDEIYQHDLNILLKRAGLEEQLDKDMQANEALAANWNTVKVWTEESRYRVSGLGGKDLYAAITGTDGVLPWIKKLW
jgi:HEPN domain-containing protein